MTTVDLGALQSAEYVVIGASAELTDERILAAGGGISIVDGGAGAAVTISVSAAGVDHGGLSGLGDDDHTQYALLAGRAGGQTLVGGAAGDLVLTTSAGNEVVINEAGIDVDARFEGDTDSNLLIIDAGNNSVGIGAVAAAGTKLHIETTTSETKMKFVNNQAPTPGKALMVWERTGLFAWTMFLDDADNSWKIASAEGFAPVRFEIATDGGIFMYNLLAAAASTDVNINGSNELHSVTSSKRFKKFIKSLDARFDSGLIYDLQPASFLWKKNTGNPDMVDFGLIAEEVYELMPELVNLDAEDKPYSIRYSLMSVMLLAEIQKLRQLMESIH